MRENDKRGLLVSLVSDQTIPNILAILHFKPDTLLFLSTQQMERKKKIEAILETSRKRGLNFKNYKRLIVNQDSIKDCMDKLQQWAEKESIQDYEITVNLTGGTKIMAIGTYEFFRHYPCQMIYIPIPKNEFIVPHPPKSIMPPTKLEFRLGVIEYLTAYGLSVLNQQKAEEQGEKAVNRFEKTAFIYDNYIEIKDLLKFLCSELRSLEKGTINKLKKGRVIAFKSIYNQKLNGREKDFLRNWKFDITSKDGRFEISCSLNYDLLKYLTGGWLEEYVYTILCDLKTKGITDVQINLQLISPKGTQNEFDVMFTYENALYFVECKSLDQEYDIGQGILYKTGALQTEFGLKVKAFLATQAKEVLDEGKNVKEHLAHRAQQMKTTILPLIKIKNLKSVFEEKIFSVR